tara:strand:+ start:1106 stop:1681 length:576 start_codon:yes stop_codon:yes gene_type:complete
MSSPFYQQFSAKSPLLQAKKTQLERANALVKESQADVDASRATFGTKNVDEAFDRKLRVLKDRVKKANSLGSDIDYDTTDASDAGEKRSSALKQISIPTKLGDLIDESTHENTTYKSGDLKSMISGMEYNVENLSEIQEDDKGQFMTTLDQDETYGGPRPTSSTVTNYDQGEGAVRDTLRPFAGKTFKNPR